MHSIPKIRVMHVEDTCQKKNSFACLLFGEGALVGFQNYTTILSERCCAFKYPP